MVQFVSPDHRVLKDELRMIEEAERELRAHLKATVPAWNLPHRLPKTVIASRIRVMAKENLALQDVEEEVRDTAINSILEENWETLWPKEWREKASGEYQRLSLV